MDIIPCILAQKCAHMRVEEFLLHALTALLDLIEEDAQKEAIHHRMQLTLRGLSSHQTYLNNRRLSTQIL